ncbi:hypothetical protein [Nonomuraea sp. bgisy101]|uniref:hypothetical protein n=1 Tax=Nonomuraea sp. bgisy101 TaxID=3413784 RepID=UPI003D735C35
MADRVVTARLRLATGEWTAGKTAVTRDLRDLNRKFAESAGAAAGFRKKIEEAAARLPKFELDANSSAAEVKLQQLRSELEKLAKQRVGIDIDARDALAEMSRLQAELAALEGGASFEVRVAAQQALEDLAHVDAEVARLDGRDVRITVDADTRAALGSIGKVGLALGGLSVAVPTVATLAAGAGALGSGFVAAGAGAKAFGVVAAATFERVQDAVDKQDYSKLSPQEYQLAQQWQEFSDVYLKWQQSLNPDVIPAISGGLGLMERTLPRISPLVAGTAQSFVGLEQRADAALNGPFWTSFLNRAGREAPAAVTGLGNSFINVTTGVAGVINAFMPWQGTVVGGIEDATKRFSEWGQALDSNQKFQAFMSYVEEHAPQVWALIKNVASALLNIGEAIAPMGVGSMAGLNLLASIVAGMDPQHIQLIAGAIVAIKLAQSGLAVASFFTELPGKLDRVRDGFDRAKGKATDFAGSLGSVEGKLGAVASVLGGAAVVGGLFLLEQRFADAATAANRYTEKVTAAAGNSLDKQIAAVNAELQKQIDLQGPNIGEWIYFTSMSTETADRVDALREELAKLTHQKDIAAIKAKAAGDAVQTSGGQMAAMGQQASTAAVDIDQLRGSLGQLVGLTTGAMTAEINFQRALDNASAAAKENGQAIETNTEKGRANREALINLAESANSYRQALVDQGTPLAEVEAKLGSQRAAFVKVAESMGFSKKEAKDLATQLGLIPGNVKSKVETPGGKEALELIKEYERKLNALDGRTVTTAVNQVIRYSRQQIIDKNKESGGIERYASGAVRRSSPPMIASRPTILFGEGNGDEAFIPYDPKYRDRAVALLGQVANDFGLSLFNKEAAKQAQDLQGGLREANTGISAGLSRATATLDATIGSAGSLTGAIVSVGDVGHDLAAGWVDGSAALGESVTDMGTAVTDAGTVVSTALGDLGATVQSLAAVIGEAVSSTSAARESAVRGTIPRAGSKTANANAVRSTRKLKAPPGYVGDAAGPTDEEIRRRLAAQVPGGSLKEAAFASGGLVLGPTRALIGEAGPEVVIPLGSRYRDEALDLLSQAATRLGVGHSLTRGTIPRRGSGTHTAMRGTIPLNASAIRSTRSLGAVVPGGSLRDAYEGGMPGVSPTPNTARVASPQPSYLPRTFAGVYAMADRGQPGGSSTRPGQGGGQPVINVDMSNSVIREEADVRRVGAEFGFEYTARAGA